MGSRNGSHEVVDALAVEDRGRTRGVVLAEPLGVPNLDVVEPAGHHDLAVEAGVLPQGLRDRDPPLLVGREVGRAGEERAGGLALAGTAMAQLLQVAGDAVELIGGNPDPSRTGPIRVRGSPFHHYAPPYATILHPVNTSTHTRHTAPTPG